MDKNKAASNSEKKWAIAIHISTLIGAVIPFGNFFAPFALWLMKKDESSFVDKHGKEALNFQISLIIYTIISTILVIVLIGFLLLLALIIFDLVQTIKAAVAASNKQEYKYPLTIKFIK